MQRWTVPRLSPGEETTVSLEPPAGGDARKGSSLDRVIQRASQLREEGFGVHGNLIFAATVAREDRDFTIDRRSTLRSGSTSISSTRAHDREAPFNHRPVAGPAPP